MCCNTKCANNKVVFSRLENQTAYDAILLFSVLTFLHIKTSGLLYVHLIYHESKSTTLNSSHNFPKC